MKESKQIGRHVYSDLKNREELTKEQEEQIKEFESKNKINPDTIKKVSNYFRVISNLKTVKFDVKQDYLIELFLKNYIDIYGKQYSFLKDSKINLWTTLYYFLKNENFFNSPILNKEFTFGKVKKKSIPNFKKGNLIIGNFGNGKTSTMKTFYKCFQEISKKHGNNDNYFITYTANEIVQMYESCDTNREKDYFWKKMLVKTIYIDDVKTEREASNYGKINIIREILERRSENKDLKTHITCNYKMGGINLTDSILEFGEIYGARVFDRLFEMFNVIEYKGNSFRN